MKNEQIVEEIKNGVSVTANMERLYMDNLPLIKRFIKPYISYEPEEDLLQEAYFGLCEAVQHYETSKNVLFMTYAGYWIKQHVLRYVKDCTSVVRLPANIRQKINRYKKSVQEYQQLYGKTPTDKDIADFMSVSIDEMQRIRLYAADIRSIDSPVQDSEELYLADTLQSDFNLENSTVDKIYDEYQKNELWGIVERYTDNRQQEIIEEHFREGKTIAEIAREFGQSFQTVKTHKDNGLRKLRTGRARRELLEKFDIVEAGIYRNSMNKFNEHGFTSTVEYIALRRAEIQAEYEQRKQQIEAMFRRRERKCL